MIARDVLNSMHSDYDVITNNSSDFANILPIASSLLLRLPSASIQSQHSRSYVAPGGEAIQS
jgi:hypothetical protein